MINKNYNIELKVLTPLCVGAGNEHDWNKGSDYIQDGGNVYILDLRKAATHGVDMDKLSILLASPDEKSILKIIGKELEVSSKYIFSSPSSTENSIKSFMRTGLYDRPVVPGSSIKGAIRSSLFKYLRCQGKEDNPSVFGDMKSGTDFMRFVKIRDIDIDDTLLVNTKIFNLRTNDEGEWEGGWKKSANSTIQNFSPVGFNTLYECAEPGKKGVGEIMLSFKQFLLAPDNIQGYPITSYDKKKNLLNDGINSLFAIINKNTKDYLEKERKFFVEYQADRTDEIVDCIDWLSQSIPADNSYCILKMSAGAGFHSITGDWQFEDYINEPGFWNDRRHAGKKKYKSRKIAEYKNKLQLMGFVKLSVIDKNTYETTLDTLKEECKQKFAEVLNVALAKKQAQEENERKRAEEKANAMRLAEFEDLYYKAVGLEDTDVRLAYEIAKKAEGLVPNGTPTANLPALLLRLEKAMNAPIVVKATKDYNRPLADVLQDVTGYMSNIIKATKGWINAGNSISEKEISVLVQSIASLPDKERKKIRDFEKVVGKANFKLLVNAR